MHTLTYIYTHTYITCVLYFPYSSTIVFAPVRGHFLGHLRSSWAASSSNLARRHTTLLTSQVEISFCTSNWMTLLI